MRYIIGSFIFFILFLNLSCKKKFCFYHRSDLRYQYLLDHATKPKVIFSLDYNYSDPKNVFWTQKSRLELDSLINKEGYFHDTLSVSQAGYYGKRFTVEGECLYCDYYKSINSSSFCEQYEE